MDTGPASLGFGDLELPLGNFLGVASMHVMYVCMYVCMYVYMYVCLYITLNSKS